MSITLDEVRETGLNKESAVNAVEAHKLVMAAADGSTKAKAVLEDKLQESQTTSDFPKALAVANNIRLLAAYKEIMPVWSGYATKEIVSDFKDQKWVDVMGGQGELDLVAEGAPYPRTALAETDGSFRVAKYGKSMGLTFEMIKNDQIRAFASAPQRLANAARRKEDQLATMQLTDGNGPNATLFGSAAAKGALGATGTTIVTSNPPLSETSLGTALTEIGVRVDYDGNPVILVGAVLVVPPQLKTTADRIVSATEYREVVSGNTIVRSNPYAGVVRVVVNPYLNTLDVGSNKATNWFVLPDPNTADKPAIVVAFLAGHETPDLRQQNNQGTRVGGGSIAAEEGSFEFDSIDYRVRHIVGTGSVDANQCAYSEGDGN